MAPHFTWLKHCGQFVMCHFSVYFLISVSPLKPDASLQPRVYPPYLWSIPELWWDPSLCLISFFVAVCLHSSSFLILFKTAIETKTSSFFHPTPPVSLFLCNHSPCTGNSGIISWPSGESLRVSLWAQMGQHFTPALRPASCLSVPDYDSLTPLYRIPSKKLVSGLNEEPIESAGLFRIWIGY